MARKRSTKKRKRRKKSAMKKIWKASLALAVLGVLLFAGWQYFQKTAPGLKIPAAAKIPAPAKTSLPKPLPPKPSLGPGPKIVIVIDDIGNTGKHVPEFVTLGNRVTYAILPLLAHSRTFASLSRKTSAEVILHLPLESAKGTIPGKGLITAAMPDEDVLRVLRHNLDSVPNVIGLNNHMGSKGTSDSRIMTLILKELKRQGLFFLDSKTTQASVAKEIAGKIGVSYLERDIFLDNIDAVEPIRRELVKLSKIARARGYAVGIGHYRPNTIQVLREEIPRLEREGFQFVTLRELLRLKQKR
jgi:uncharacterized protein